MSTISVRFGKNGNPPTEHPISFVEAAIDEAIKELNIIVVTNQNFLAEKLHLPPNTVPVCFTYYQHHGSPERDLKRHGFFTAKVVKVTPIHVVAPWMLNMITDTVRELEYLIDRCEEFKNTIKASTDGTAKGFAVQLKYSNPTEVMFEVICSPAGACCHKCGALLTSASISRHIDTMACITARLSRELSESRDFVKIGSDTLEKAVKKANIECEVHPIAYGMWAPKWVVDAYKKFNEGNGYAGMSLAEYLQKMKP